MTTANDILAHLSDLWEAAEPGPFGADDAVIIQYASGECAVRPRAGYDSEGEALGHIRILERAKPKRPQYVVASMLYTDDVTRREPFIEREDDRWESPTAFGPADDLIDPVPLVELPRHEELRKKFNGIWASRDGEWPGSDALADAVLELLRGER